MNTLEIEDRVRAATRAAADTVVPDSVPPLRLPSDRPFRSRSRWFASMWGPWLAPVAAAAAVVAVAVAMVTVGRTMDNRTGTGAAASASARPGPVKTGPAISSYVAAGRVPRYYVSIESQGNPNFHPSYAVVRATATGAALGSVSPPSGQTVIAVTAAADDGEFMLDTQPFASASSNANQNFEPRAFREVRLRPDGSIVSVSKLAVSVPGGQLMTGFALSPDGSRLAIAVQPGTDKREPDLTEVKVIALTTGAVQTWIGNGTIGTGPDDARSLSWTADGRTLAFTWGAAGPGIHTGVRLLNLATGGGSLLADSREAVSLIIQAGLATVPISSVSPSVSASVPDPSVSGLPVSGPSVSGSASPSAFPTSATLAPALSATAPTCQLDSVITPDGSAIVCGAVAVTSLNGSGPASGAVASPATILASGAVANPAVGLRRGAETEFIEYSTASGKVARVLGHWTFGSVGALSVDVLWSDASGSVLIGVIPNSDTGRVGVISGNEFTPLPATASDGTW